MLVAQGGRRHVPSAEPLDDLRADARVRQARGEGVAEVVEAATGEPRRKVSQTGRTDEI